MNRKKKKKNVYSDYKVWAPENMRDSNVTFNTLLKDNKNQVKRDSLHFPLALCTHSLHIMRSEHVVEKRAYTESKHKK